MSDEFKIIEGFDGVVIEDEQIDERQWSTDTLDAYADIVYCIDLTKSMSPIIQKVKETARSLHKDLQERMKNNYHRTIKQLRVSVIGFRDFYCDGDNAIEISRFFYLPEETNEFEDFVNRLEAKGGGDTPENALEALALAMQSDWCTVTDPTAVKKHIIVLFTDAPAHPFEKAELCVQSNYPENMPKSYLELVEWWWNSQDTLGSDISVKMDQQAKRLAIFAPDCDPWSDMAIDFDYTITHCIEANNGGKDINTESLLDIICETIY